MDKLVHSDAHCDACNVNAHVHAGVLGKKHHGPSVRITSAGPVGKPNACGGRWVGGHVGAEAK